MSDDADRWRRVLAELPPCSLSQAGGLLVAPGLAYPGHHRHFSHALGVHPLGVFAGIDGSDEERRIAVATTGELDAASGEFWMGYSHAWAAAMSARIGDGATARRRLLDYGAAFTFPNGFHANGDWRGLGYGKAPFGAFTLEGAMGAADAIQTMLLQSAPGLVRLFPALPPAWSEASFDGLRADGAILVSAAMEGGRLARVRLNPRVSGRIRLALGVRTPAVDLDLRGGADVELDAQLSAALEAAPTTEGVSDPVPETI
jgi:hypothetical protein